MKKSFYIVLVTLLPAVLATGLLAQTQSISQSAPAKTKTMTIKWQRLVGNAGQTCDRCGATQIEVRNALDLLRKSLAPLGISVVLEEKTLDKATAAKNISESNRIWVASKPLEMWLGATTGASNCTSCCALCGANVQCRTITVSGKTYESIPSALIVKAGLLAAADIVGDEAVQPGSVQNNPPPKPYGLESLGSGGCSGGSCGPGGCGK